MSRRAAEGYLGGDERHRTGSLENPYTNQESIKAAAARPLGTLTFGLIAINMFNPDAHRGHKVAVKGLLIKDPKGDRLNVTSLQMVSATCP